MITASAPGKLVLIGEYAVLEGHRALGVAIDRRAKAQWRWSPSAQDHIRLDLTPLAQERIEVPVGCSVSWAQSVTGDLDLAPLSATLDDIHNLIKAMAPDVSDQPFDLQIDTSALFSTSGVKLGLGSSAAVAAVLAGLCWRIQGLDTSNLDQLHAQLWSQPAYAQGSGLDLAITLTGGLVEYRTGDGPGHPAQWSRVAWPEAVSGRVVWTGQSASSSRLVEAYRDWKARDTKRWSQCLEGLSHSSEQAIAALMGGDIAGFLAGLEDYGARVGTMGGWMGECLRTPMHERLEVLAKRFGVAYKSAGAGGGDVGILLSDDPTKIEALEPTLAKWAVEVMPLAVTQHGLELE